MLEILDLKRDYGRTRALAGLDLTVRRGEVLGIAGPNGAGKSTLIKLLAGEDRATSGQILLDGEPWLPHATRDLAAVVHQEPQLFPNLTVLENLYVGRENSRLSRPRPGVHEEAILADLQLEAVQHKTLRTLPLAIQQRTEIARALARDAGLFLFDEPNSALTLAESDQLYLRMSQIASRGRMVILVSHRLAELATNATRVAIIRDGLCVRILEGEELTQEAIATELVVETHSDDRSVQSPTTRPAQANSLLTVRNWVHRGGAFQVPSLDVPRGEIIAVVGVEGSGAREFVASLGAREPVSGLAEIGGERASHRQLSRATAYIPASRRESLFPNFNVGENLVSRLGAGEIATRSWWLQRRRIGSVAEATRQAFKVKCSSVKQPIRGLSGGNQQKVALAAAIRPKPRILVAAEPTRGVDIGSKVEIYHLLREFANEGNAVVMYCTELPEVYDAADRVHLMQAGRLSDPIDVHAHSNVRDLALAIASLEQQSSDRGIMDVE